MKVYILLFLLQTLAFFACDTQNKRFPKADKISAKPPVHTNDKKATLADTLESLRDTSQIAAITAARNPNFPEVFGKFFNSIQTKNSIAFNQFIHPEYGLYILEQPGAVPFFSQIADIRAFRRHYQKKDFFSIRQEFTACSLHEAPLPTFNCEGVAGNPAGYTKQGCFVADARAFQQNQAHLYAGLTPAEIKQIVKIKTNLTKTVLHTGTGYKFYWGNIKGQWYVLFIELITPCSA